MAVEIVAEAAQGYEGNLTLARLLVRAAGASGADAVKFQLVLADELATPDYQHYGLFRQLQMPPESWQMVVEEAHGTGLRLYFDVFGEESLDLAVGLGADGVKIHASDVFNVALVRAARARLGRIFISLGGVALEEVDALLADSSAGLESHVCLMYGFQAEPTPAGAVNLRRLGALRARFRSYRLGFMDHADGDSDDAGVLALLALPFEVDCIEKHLTLDRSLRLEDYVSAVAPDQFRLFVDRVRRLEAALGSARLELTDLERAYRQKMVKVVVAARALRRGETIAAEALALKRVGAPAARPIHRIDGVAGRTAAVDVQPNQQVTEDMLR